MVALSDSLLDNLKFVRYIRPPTNIKFTVLACPDPLLRDINSYIGSILYLRSWVKSFEILKSYRKS
jgi:hypothetical protein